MAEKERMGTFQLSNKKTVCLLYLVIFFSLLIILVLLKLALLDKENSLVIFTVNRCVNQQTGSEHLQCVVQ